MQVGTITDDARMFDVPKLRVCALRFTETARARILKVRRSTTRECTPVPQCQRNAPLKRGTAALPASAALRQTSER